jgi:hypothetical protein
MEALKYKIRISVLWIFLAVSTSAVMILMLMEPGIIEKTMAGELPGRKISEGMIILFATFWLIPLGMAFLTQIFKHSVNRWVNLIIGIVFVLSEIYNIINHISIGWLPLSFLLIVIFKIVVTVLIVWYAWKLPKPEA